MTSALNDRSLDEIFRSAPNGWTDRPVEEDTVREIYDLMKWGPTSANSSPARFVWVRSADGKATPSGLAAEPNKQKILQAPVTVIIGHDLDFAGKLPKLMPHAARGDAAVLCGTRRGRGDGDAKRNAARRLPHHRCAGVGTGLRPMSGFDNAGVDKAVFSGTRIESNFICSIGYGDAASVFPHNPRLSFEEAGRWV